MINVNEPGYEQHLRAIDLLRLSGRVKRFHTSRNLSQTLAEHSHGVAMLYMYLCEGMPRAEALAACLVHDLSEKVSGDTPGPTKWGNPEIREALNELTTDVEERWGIRFKLTEEEAALVKYCDHADLALFAMEEWKSGDRYARQIVVNILNNMANPPNRTARFFDNELRSRFGEYDSGDFNLGDQRHDF